MAKTSSGLEENVAGLLCYVGLWVSGLIFLLLEPKNKFVRFHAAQSIIVFGFLNVVSVFFFWIPFIGWLAGGLAIALWIVLMVRAYQGVLYKLPVAGDIADSLAGTKKDTKKEE